VLLANDRPMCLLIIIVELTIIDSNSSGSANGIPAEFDSSGVHVANG